MRKFLIIPCFFVTSLISHAQSTPNYASFKLEVKEDYTAEVDKAALQAATQILSTPDNDKNISRLEAVQFLIRWMTGTPTDKFTLDNRAGKVAKQDLLIVYMAGMAKYCLENPSEGNNEKLVELNAVKSLLGYCGQHGIKLTGELKRFSQANEKGELEKRLGE
jgi:hypothetical protein